MLSLTLSLLVVFSLELIYLKMITHRNRSLAYPCVNRSKWGNRHQQEQQQKQNWMAFSRRRELLCNLRLSAFN